MHSNHVEALLEAHDGRFWVATPSGLNLMHPETETFTRYPFDGGEQSIQALVETADGTLWIGGKGGLSRFHPDTGVYERIALPGDNTIDFSSSLFVDAHDKLWISTGTGLMRLDPDDLSVEVKLRAQPSERSWTGAILADVSDPEVLWLGGWGITRYDTRTGDHTTFLVDIDNPETNWIISVVQDPTDPAILWGSTFPGLLRFDTRRQHFDDYVPHASDPYGLSGDAICCLYVDRSGLIWMGPANKGLSYFDPSGRVFTHYRKIAGDSNSLYYPAIRGFAEDTSGALWIAQFESLSRLDRQTGTYTHYPVEPDNPQALHGQLNRVLIDQEEMLWVIARNIGGGGGRLHRLDPGSGQVHHAVVGEPNEDVATLYIDREGVLWIGTTADLYHYNRETDTFIPLGVDEGRLPLSRLYEDRAGRFWLGTGGRSLGLIDRATGDVTWYPHDPRNPNTPSHVNITSLHEREREPGILWIGTYGGGLDRFDTRTGTFTHYSEKDNLPNNVVYGILEDEAGMLWLSTNRGIARFNPDTEAFHAYGLERGIQSLEFNGGAFYQSPTTGEMFFGGPNGFNAFHPADVVDDTTAPPVVFTELRLFNQPVTPGPDAPITKAIDRAEEIRLQPGQDVFTLEFAALSFRNPEGNTYRYLLEGYDRNWVEAGTKRSATYTNLSPGHYTFRVHAANADGAWNEEGAAVRVVILPPWWRTGWAYTLYGLLFLGGLLAVDRIQRRRLIARERDKARERELEQAREIEKAYTQLKATQAQLIQTEKMASLGQLTAGIAHEIKNPLNFVNNFAEVNEELAQELREALANGDDLNDIIDDLERNARVIAQHGKRADGIVHAMMQHASGGTGQRESIDINQLVSEHIDLAYHGKRAQRPDLTVEIERDLGEVGVVEIVPQEIGRVLLNLLGNAFDAVHEHAATVNSTYVPSVTVSTRQVEGHVEIRVSDNGSGIPAGIKEKIFEPFFTTKPAGSGTGLGLSLSYDIVTQGHGGTLAVESTEGEGATFIVTLPTGSRT